MPRAKPRDWNDVKFAIHNYGIDEDTRACALQTVKGLTDRGVALPSWVILTDREPDDIKRTEPRIALVWEPSKAASYPFLVVYHDRCTVGHYEAETYTAVLLDNEARDTQDTMVLIRALAAYLIHPDVVTTNEEYQR